MKPETLNLLLMALTPLVLACLKLLVPRVPKLFLPLLAPVVGVGLDYVMGLAGATTNGTLAAAVYSASGVWLREVYDQVKKAGTDGLAPSGKFGLWALCAGLAGCLLMGCSSVTQSATRTEMGADGKPIVTTGKTTLRTVIQSSQNVDKIRLSNGKTISFGASGVDQQSEASKTIDAMTAMAIALGEMYASDQTGGAIKKPAKRATATAEAEQVVNPSSAVNTNGEQVVTLGNTGFSKIIVTKAGTLLLCRPDGSCIEVAKPK
jgi:hypothetical protein